jgi:hypothetical protein
MTNSYKDASNHFEKYLSESKKYLWHLFKINYLNLKSGLAKAEGCEIEQQRAYTTLGRMYLFLAQLADTEVEKKDAIGSAYRYNLKGISYANKLAESAKIDGKEAATMKSRLNINIALCFEIEGRNKDAGNYAEAVMISFCNIQVAQIYIFAGPKTSAR